MILAASDPDVTLRGLLLDWSFDPLPIIGLVVGLVLYVGGVRRLAHRGRRWPPARTVSFVSGTVVVALALLSGLASYDESRFVVHVVQHLMVSMVAAVFFVLSGPITLALQAGSRTTQRRLVRVLHSRPIAALTHPVAALALFGGTLFVLYFTGLYDLSLRNRSVHELVHLHFLFVGLLFFWMVVGVDVMRGRLPYGACLLCVLATVPMHAFLGIALMSSSSPLFSSHTLADQRAGAGILWAVGDLVTLVVGGIVLAQWMSHEERVAAREDRLGPDGLAGAQPSSQSGIDPVGVVEDTC
ncbi:MAG TPA: cytochrome c oxidase assembly protein [Acidimicrobiales bacterium]|nr:cytochrome c oxidase assembly protein [Acidimicrobiales bacterium]